MTGKQTARLATPENDSGDVIMPNTPPAGESQHNPAGVLLLTPAGIAWTVSTI
jgi:hypothetical protein